ncbi:MAG TPA: STAS domain-containing protein [Solirubrobacterales bacterium]|nr:STAS domain-containing protein [Solirubrobacterales bacterium]
MTPQDANSVPAPNPFELQDEELDGVRVIAICGELDLSTAPRLEEPLEAAVAADAALLIDLSACEFIDSTGIALIVRTWQRLGGEGENGTARRFALCGLGDQVRRLLEVSGLESALPTHGTREDAISALRG